MFAVITKHTS